MQPNEKRRIRTTMQPEPEPEPKPGPAGSTAAKPNRKSKRKQRKPKPTRAKSTTGGGDDDDALLAAAMAENEAFRQAQQEQSLEVVEEMLQSDSHTSFDERNKALRFKQMATRTIIPGQPLPKELTAALQMALKEVEAEEAAAGRAEQEQDPSATAQQPFANAPPSSSTDPRALRRQKLMLERMRKKQHENRERQKLAAIDPSEAENCKRYNLTANQLRAVRKVGLRLPHECREQNAAMSEKAAIEAEDVLFDEGMSLDDMFFALREDDRFMGR